MRERDTQQRKLYRAEAVYTGTTRMTDDYFDMKKFVAKVWKSKRVHKAFSRMYPKTVPYVGDGRARTHAGGNARGIYMPVWSRSEGIILHELAHTINQRVNGQDPAGHGWQFASIYLKLVLYIHGREAHDLLKKGMKLHRVRFTEPRKRKPMDPARKAELVARLAAYREKQQLAA